MNIRQIPHFQSKNVSVQTARSHVILGIWSFYILNELGHFVKIWPLCLKIGGVLFCCNTTI